MVSKSRLAQCLCKSLWYRVPALPLVVCSGMESLLAPCAPSIRLIFPGSWVWCISASHIYVVILSMRLFTSSVWAVAPSAQCEQWNYVVCVGMSMFLLMSKRIVIPRVISLVTCQYSVNESVVSSTGWNESSGRVCLLRIAISTVMPTGYLDCVSSLVIDVDGSASTVVASGFWASTVLLVFVSFDKTTKLKCAVISSSARSSVSREA